MDNLKIDNQGIYSKISVDIRNLGSLDYKAGQISFIDQMMSGTKYGWPNTYATDFDIKDMSMAPLTQSSIYSGVKGKAFMWGNAFYNSKIANIELNSMMHNFPTKNSITVDWYMKNDGKQYKFHEYYDQSILEWSGKNNYQLFTLPDAVDPPSNGVDLTVTMSSNSIFGTNAWNYEWEHWNMVIRDSSGQMMFLYSITAQEASGNVVKNISLEPGVYDVNMEENPNAKLFKAADVKAQRVEEGETVAWNVALSTSNNFKLNERSYNNLGLTGNKLVVPEPNLPGLWLKVDDPDLSSNDFNNVTVNVHCYNWGTAELPASRIIVDSTDLSANIGPIAVDSSVIITFTIPTEQTERTLNISFENTSNTTLQPNNGLFSSASVDIIKTADKYYKLKLYNGAGFSNAWANMGDEVWTYELQLLGSSNNIINKIGKKFTTGTSTESNLFPLYNETYFTKLIENPRAVLADPNEIKWELVDSNDTIIQVFNNANNNRDNLINSHLIVNKDTDGSPPVKIVQVSELFEGGYRSGACRLAIVNTSQNNIDLTSLTLYNSNNEEIAGLVDNNDWTKVGNKLTNHSALSSGNSVYVNLENVLVDCYVSLNSGGTDISYTLSRTVNNLADLSVSIVEVPNSILPDASGVPETMLLRVTVKNISNTNYILYNSYDNVLKLNLTGIIEKDGNELAYNYNAAFKAHDNNIIRNLDINPGTTIAPNEEGWAEFRVPLDRTFGNLKHSLAKFNVTLTGETDSVNILNPELTLSNNVASMVPSVNNGYNDDVWSSDIEITASEVVISGNQAYVDISVTSLRANPDTQVIPADDPNAESYMLGNGWIVGSIYENGSRIENTVVVSVTNQVAYDSNGVSGDYGGGYNIINQGWGYFFFFNNVSDPDSNGYWSQGTSNTGRLTFNRGTNDRILTFKLLQHENDPVTSNNEVTFTIPGTN